MTVGERIVPGFVGVDIGCGMETVNPIYNFKASEFAGGGKRR
jgi:RNA-splicing ligase RtcB